MQILTLMICRVLSKLRGLDHRRGTTLTTAVPCSPAAPTNGIARRALLAASAWHCSPPPLDIARRLRLALLAGSAWHCSPAPLGIARRLRERNWRVDKTGVDKAGVDKAGVDKAGCVAGVDTEAAEHLLRSKLQRVCMPSTSRVAHTASSLFGVLGGKHDGVVDLDEFIQVQTALLAVQQLFQRIAATAVRLTAMRQGARRLARSGCSRSTMKAIWARQSADSSGTGHSNSEYDIC